MSETAVKKLSDAMVSKVRELQSRYPEKRAALIPSLMMIQMEEKGISALAQEHLAELFDLEPSEVRGTMEFYTMLTEKPQGKFHFALCDCISCYIRGAVPILGYLEDKLGIKAGGITEDGKVSLERVECLGACDGAPMMQVNGINKMNLTEEKIDKILEECE